MPTKRNLSNEQSKLGEGTIALRTRSKRKRSTADRLDTKNPLKAMEKPPREMLPPSTGEQSTPQECGICLDPVKTRGLLDSCDHVFCFPCIMKWTKRSSNCPHCKREVVKITKASTAGEKILSSHVVKRRNLKDTLDREEFQQRSRQFSNANRRRAYAFIDDPSAYVPLTPHNSYTGGLNTDVTRHLFNMHQMIRDNMNRVSSSLRGLQDNLNNLTMLNVSSQGNMMPLGMGLCNFPGLGNINVTVNGFPQPDFFPPPLLQQDPYLAFNNEMAGQQLPSAQQPQAHNQMNYFVPFAFSGSPLFPQEISQTMENMNRYTQTQAQNMFNAQVNELQRSFEAQHDPSYSFPSRSSERSAPPPSGHGEHFGPFPQ